MTYNYILDLDIVKRNQPNLNEKAKKIIVIDEGHNVEKTAES
jgi:hypothetical protein